MLPSLVEVDAFLGDLALGGEELEEAFQNSDRLHVQGIVVHVIQLLGFEFEDGQGLELGIRILSIE